MFPRGCATMAYLIFTANGEEYDRRELRAGRPLTIGRAPDCDVSVHDIILSRHHCRIEQDADGKWVVADLHSKNGTHYLGHKIERHVLREADELRIGRTRLTFKAGAYAPSPNVRKRAVVRPSDPKEALAGTVTGMVVCEPGETEKYEAMPFPQPRPSDPSSYARDGVYGMINEIISSSWDSIQAQASQPTRMQRAMPVPAVTKAQRGAIQPKPRVSFALQAHGDAEPSGTKPPGAKASSKGTSRPGATLAAGGRVRPDHDPVAAPMRLHPPTAPPRRGRRRRWVVAVSTLVATLLLVVACVTLILQTAPRPILEDLPHPPARQQGARHGRSPGAAPPAPARSTDAIAGLDLTPSHLLGL